MSAAASNIGRLKVGTSREWSWQHSLEGEALAVQLQQEVLSGLLDGPAQGPERVRGRAHGVEVNDECCVGQADSHQGHVWDVGCFPHPRLWRGVGVAMVHGGATEGVCEDVLP